MKEIQDINHLYEEVREIIASARQNAVRSVDFSRVQMYWQIGRRIQEEELKGKERADYGAYLLKNLAKKLEPEYGSGFSARLQAPDRIDPTPAGVGTMSAFSV